MSKRKREKSRKKYSFIVLTGILFLLAAGMGVTHVWTLFHSDTILLTPPVANYRAAREIYPYSVIPGGVRDAQEVADTIAHDAVARAHYAGIHAERLWTTRASEPMLAYVSYRKGDSVRWTTHPVHIAQGEIILTDGTNRIRGRCGNRIEFKKPTPLSGSVSTPDVPPPDIVFDTPMPSLNSSVIVPPLPPPLAPLEISDTQPTPPPVPTLCAGPACVPPPAPLCTGSECVPPTVPPSCTGAGCLPPTPPSCTGAGCLPPTPPSCTGAGCSPPVVPVPEPGISLLLGAGFVILTKLGLLKQR